MIYKPAAIVIRYRAADRIWPSMWLNVLSQISRTHGGHKTQRLEMAAAAAAATIGVII